MAENKNRLRVQPAPVIEETIAEPKNKTKSKSEKPVKAEKAKKKPTSKVAKRRKESDGRVRICFGIFFLMITIFLLIAFASPYLGLAPKGEWLNTLGVFMSEEMFGIGTIYLIFLIGILSVSLFEKRPILKMWTIWKYCLIFLIWIPLLIATINVLPDIYCGRVGHKCYEFLHQYIGLAGIILLLVFSALIYIIFNFNIKFDFLKRKEREPEEDDDDDITPEEDPSPSLNTQYYTGIEENPTEIDLTDDKPEENDAEDDIFDEDEDEDDNVEIKDEPEDDGFEDVVIEKPAEKPTKTDEVEMVVEQQVEEKQAKEIGEHFGIDTVYDPKLELSDFKLPPLDLLKDYGDGTNVIDRDELEANKKRIVDTLANYSIEIDKIKATIGPTVTLYEIVPAAGVRISKIKNLQDDIALSLAALGIRIIAPIPGKGTVGIEVPNKKPQTVSMRSIIGSEKFQNSGYALPFGIGKTISNESYVADLAKILAQPSCRYSSSHPIRHGHRQPVRH
ncbi:MAG: DNA translocase FtsK 4TM domain-containing protein [Bacteroidales bacterium]|nr:DNA translocase FtsK 4TM domain-containing protein [Bacteroidales bacterium]